MAKRVFDSAETLDRSKSQQNGPGLSKTNYVDLKPDATTGQTVRTLRVVGPYLEYVDHSSYKRDPNNPKERIKVSFDDAEANKSFSRICNDEDKDNCYWCQKGFAAATKFAWVCLERQADGSSVVKILNKGKMLFDLLFNIEKENKEINLQEPDSGLCENLGGEVAPWFRITADVDKGPGNVKYSVGVFPKQKAITAEEVELLKASYCPTPEEFEQLYAAAPKMRDAPVWYSYGYALDRIYKYRGLKDNAQSTGTPTVTTPPADLEVSVSVDSNDDTNDAPALNTTPARKATGRKAADVTTPAPVTSTNMYVDDDSDTASTTTEDPDEDPGW